MCQSTSMAFVLYRTLSSYFNPDISIKFSQYIFYFYWQHLYLVHYKAVSLLSLFHYYTIMHMKVTNLGLPTGSLSVKCSEMQLSCFQRDYN